MTQYSNQIQRLKQPIRDIVNDYENWNDPFERRMLPEKKALEGIQGKQDRSLFLTMTVSVNYLRDARQLWDTSKNLWQSENWLFRPEKVAQQQESSIEDIFENQGFRFPNKDAGIWYENASTIHSRFDSNPLNLFKKNDFNAKQILGFVRKTSGFSYLGGNKIGSLWMRLIHEEVHPLDDIEHIDIPVDTQVRQLTNTLLDEDYDDDEIRQFWIDFCQENGLDPVKVDQPLWLIGNNWSSWGQTYLQNMVGE